MNILVIKYNNNNNQPINSIMSNSTNFQQNVWCIRQNPSAKTNQHQMRDLVISQKIVTCPFGHLSIARENVINGTYNEENPIWKSQSQDRKFIETMKIGDIILIPFSGIKECVMARITSEPINGIETNLFTNATYDNNKIELLENGEIPFRPVGRQIEIIHTNVLFENKRNLPRQTLSLIKSLMILSHIKLYM
jgi:hypothetical protein